MSRRSRLLHGRGSFCARKAISSWPHLAASGTSAVSPEKRACPSRFEDAAAPRRRIRRPRRSRAAWHPLLRRQPAGALRGRRRPPLRRRVPPRTHADSPRSATTTSSSTSSSLHRPPNRSRPHRHPGHYARNRYDEARGRWILARPADTTKDQDLLSLRPHPGAAEPNHLPLGEMQKPAVRKVAEDQGLYVAQKPDSQEICFIPGGDYSNFLKAYLDRAERRDA